MTKGFSLVEMIIVIAMSICMFGILSFLFYTFNKTTEYERAAISASGSANAFMQEIAALAVPSDAVLPSHSFGGTAYISSSTTLILEIPSVDNTGAVIMNTYDYSVFYMDGTKAYRLLEANPSSSRPSGVKLLSSSVQELSFSYDNGTNTITADIVVSGEVKGDSFSDHRQESFRLRNL